MQKKKDRSFTAGRNNCFAFMGRASNGTGDAGFWTAGEIFTKVRKIFDNQRVVERIGWIREITDI